jgi:hypothetical protein
MPLWNTSPDPNGILLTGCGHFPHVHANALLCTIVRPISRPIVFAQPPSKFCNEFSDVLAWDPAEGGGV